jgi:hypothetical protein
MKYLPASVPEVLEWLDVFCSSTGLSSTMAADVYAELCYVPTSTFLFAKVSQREIMLDALEHNDEDEYHEQMSQYSISCDENLVDYDEEAYSLRMDHYTMVLEHHGFTQAFIDAFLENMSPSSDSRPSPVALEEIFEDGKFDPEPLFYSEEDLEGEDEVSQDDLETLEAAANHMMGHQRLARAVNPKGWIALLTKLGFEFVEGSIAEEHQIGEPSFFIADKECGHVPVFIVGANRKAYDDQDDAGQIIRMMVQTITRMNGCPLALLFYGAPDMISDDKNLSEGLVFWGEVFVASAWGEMVIHQGTNSVSKIIEDAKVVTNGLDTFEKALYRDKGLALMNHWIDNHVFAVETID